MFTIDSKEAPNANRPYVGVRSLGWALFEHFNIFTKAVWIDLEELRSPHELLQRITLAVGHRAGAPQPKPQLLDFSYKKDLGPRPSMVTCGDLIEELTSYLKQSGREWVFFINARGVLTDKIITDLALKNEAKDECWGSSHFELCAEYLNILLSTEGVPVSVVLLKYSRLLPTLQYPNDQYHVGEDLIPWNPRVFQSAAETLFQGEAATRGVARFAYAISICRQPLHITALGNWVLHPEYTSSRDQDFERSYWAGKWLRKLVDMGVVKVKPGRFVWMPKVARMVFAKELLQAASKFNIPLPIWDIHQGLADWHTMLFHDSNDPLAIFEAVHHLCSCAKFVLNLEDTETIIKSSLTQAFNILTIGQACILKRAHFSDLYESLAELESTIKHQTARYEREHPGNWLIDSLRALNLQLLSFKAGVARDLGDHETVGNAIRSVKELSGKVAVHASAASTFNEQIQLETSLEDAILAISLRSYKAAEERLLNILTRIGIGLSDDDFGLAILNVRTQVRSWIQNAKPTDNVRIYTVKVLRRLMYVKMVRCECAWFENPKSPAHRKHLLTIAAGIYHAAREILRHIECISHPGLSVESSRLLGQMASVLVQLKRPYEAIRRTNEAKALLSNVPLGEASIAAAVIDLRQMESTIKNISQMETFIFIREFVRDHVIRSRIGRYVRQDRIRNIIAWLEYAELIILHVERRLTRDRRSLWWWGLMCYYKMKAFEYHAVLQKWNKLLSGELADIRDRLQAAVSAGADKQMGGKQTFSLQNLTIYLRDPQYEINRSPEELMKDVCLRIKKDPFRVATIIKAYLSHLKVVGATFDKLGCDKHDVLRRCKQSLEDNVRRRDEEAVSYDSDLGIEPTAMKFIIAVQADLGAIMG